MPFERCCWCWLDQFVFDETKNCYWRCWRWVYNTFGVQSSNSFFHQCFSSCRWFVCNESWSSYTTRQTGGSYPGETALVEPLTRTTSPTATANQTISPRGLVHLPVVLPCPKKFSRHVEGVPKGVHEMKNYGRCPYTEIWHKITANSWWHHN